MLETLLRALMAPLEPALGNHLWQSTAFLAVAGVLTLLLRTNRARVRYGLWLAASIKFLIPFSLLIVIGAHVSVPRIIKPAEPAYWLAAQEASQPFTRRAGVNERRLPRELATDWRYRLLPAIPAAFLVVWLGGSLLVLAGWWRRWREVAMAVHCGEFLPQGREVEALRRVANRVGLRKTIRVVLSPTSLEPGILGIVRPVLVWPAGISEHLQDAHLEAILAHEVEHVRRRDNLAAAIHMAVDAIFWFHPLVWWLGARLVEERERACDEAAVQLVSEPAVYAESILKTCQFCLESPLACVSGITGGELKKRITRIMTQRGADKLSLSKKLLLAAAGIATVAGPTMFGIMNAPQIRVQAAQATSKPLPAFEVAAIKPSRPGEKRFSQFNWSRLTVTSATAKWLIEFGYSAFQPKANLSDDQLLGGPGWINSEAYDIDAKVEDPLAEELRQLPMGQIGGQIRLMTQSLLSNRFKLKVHHETKELPVYALVAARGGPKFLQTRFTAPQPASATQGANPSAPATPGLRPYRLRGPVTNLAGLLSGIPVIGRQIVDKTGIQGNYEFVFDVPLDQRPPAMNGGAEHDPSSGSILPSEPSGPSIFTLLQEQLGLKLESTKGPVDVLVIDHIERPSEN